MDLYELTQAIWRRKYFVLVGLVGLVAVVGFLASRLGSAEKYEATVQMAVVPTEAGLSDAALGSGSLATVAEIYAQLLGSKNARLDIEEETGVELVDELQVATAARTPVISVTVYAAAESDSVAAALGAYDWLTGTLTDPAVIDAIPTPTTTTSVDLFGETIYPEPFDALPVTVLLMTPDPASEETGTARAPIITGAALVAGLTLLLLTTIAVDSWLSAYSADTAARRAATSSRLDALSGDDDQRPDEPEPSDDEPEPSD